MTAVLTLNAGSTSLKFALFDGDQAILRGGYENIVEAPQAQAKSADGTTLPPPEINGLGHEAMLPGLFPWLARHLEGRTIAAIGHRIVHGGARFFGATHADEATIAAIEALTPLAPLHQPHGVAGIRAARKAAPGLPQVACFDTAFHHTMPALATHTTLPARLELRRYGFHGLSYEWIASRLPPRLAAGRVVAAHLGGGASLCALLAGRSIETTMSATPLDGLPMATRSGAVDPGLLLYLLREHGLSVAALEHTLYYESGLRGVSGMSGDMRVLRQSDRPEAAFAIDLFAYRIALGVGAMAAALGGIDGLVFTGGIGEHDAALRDAVCGKMAWLGGGLPVLVIPADEEAVIARQVLAVLPG